MEGVLGMEVHGSTVTQTWDQYIVCFLIQDTAYLAFIVMVLSSHGCTSHPHDSELGRGYFSLVG
jgi:hypothetical protein